MAPAPSIFLFCLSVCLSACLPSTPAHSLTPDSPAPSSGGSLARNIDPANRAGSGNFAWAPYAKLHIFLQKNPLELKKPAPKKLFGAELPPNFNEGQLEAALDGNFAESPPLRNPSIQNIGLPMVA